MYLLSPLLHSLMATISEDTVIALTAFLLITHLYLHDYSFVNSVTDKLTGTLSLGAAVFASVLIASGMPTDFDVVRTCTLRDSVQLNSDRPVRLAGPPLILQIRCLSSLFRLSLSPLRLVPYH